MKLLIDELSAAERASFELWPSATGTTIKVSTACLESTLGQRPKLIQCGGQFAVMNHTWSTRASKLATEILSNFVQAHPNLECNLDTDHWGVPRVFVHEEINSRMPNSSIS